MIYGDSGTELRAADLKGDSTGTIILTGSQVFRAAFVEGVIGTFTITVNIVVGENAILHVPNTLIVEGVTLDIMGTCTYKILEVESGGVIKGYNTSYTSAYAGGAYRATSDQGKYTLSSVRLEAGSLFQFAGNLHMLLTKFELKRYVVLKADYVFIQAVTVIVEREASLNTVGRASIDDSAVPSSAHGTGKNGGAHAAGGGVGSGIPVEYASEPYGTIYNPLTPGSAGGQGGLGGGYIYIGTDELYLDGYLQASGEDSSTGGGGAGGSIFVECQTLKGLGSMESNGGNAETSDAGAGSAGHIAVLMTSDEFQGTYSAHGGSSPAVHGDGGPGSIYTLSDKNGEQLVLDNKNGQKDFYTTLNEDDLDLVFDVLEMFNYAKLQMVKDGVKRSLVINKILGDGTGLLRVQTNQTGTLQRIQGGTESNSKVYTNLELHEGGEFILSHVTTILGDGDVSLDLDGTMRGVNELYLGSGRKMRIGSNAKVVALDETDIASIDVVTLAKLQLEPGSFVEYDAGTSAKIQAGEINLKFDTDLYADGFDITVSNMDIELEAVMSCSPDDRPDSSGIDVTTGSGLPGDVVNKGAGHGGIGGGYDYEDLGTIGTYYNSVYRPTMRGSRGTYNSSTGLKSGGRGAGAMDIKVGGKMIVDGTLSANGENADPAGGNGGAGSGGSIWIKVYDFEGYGTLSVYGGDGSVNNGAGAGGRIAINCTQQIDFDGQYIAYGGKGPEDILGGGAGTVFLEDKRFSLTYKRLLLDNNGNSPEKLAVIKEDEDMKHYFDEVHLLQNASLQFVTDQQDLDIEVESFFGDRSGLVKLNDSQTLYAEYKPSIRYAFVAGVNFIIGNGAEIYFPSIVYVYGDGVFLSDQTESRSIAISGRITGIADFILGFETLVYLAEGAHTASLDQQSGGYDQIDSAGTVTFASLDLNSYAQMKYGPDLSVVQQIARIDARYRSVISAENITIQAGIFNLEAGAKLTSSAIDRPLDFLDESAGSGIDANANLTTKGSGAGHATEGGGNESY